ncbi:hypothetical protein K503DRAFT_858965 [Rhizopogon vinicolor AM-OR11-026]|uniref:Uncharacterized protein n=1 Tax=Rhizopogon vinicolor AM-OR11-026 TaxID=1314800 RepID=A0A1B7MQH2_9AGAM|nr:hypothetical protein K503DRAFT_858965 [Rhizopogon vinicolor AM-OR11-026]
MTSILHALSSTFTTCACGARARDCVLNVMAQFVDGELDSAGPERTPNLSSPQTLNGTLNGHGTRQAVVSDACEGSSSDKENWGHVRGAVGLGIQLNANGGANSGANGNSNSNNHGLNGTAASAFAAPGRKVDLGPLIGAKRGFRTREKVPFGGGVGGVEMVPSAGYVGPASFGAGPSSESSGMGSSSLGTAAGPSSSNWPPMTSSTGPSRSYSASGARVRSYDRKGKGRATEQTNEDVDVDVEGDAPNPNAMDVDEEKIPPRMRKRWMHSVSSHDRDRRVSLPNGRGPASMLSPPGYGQTPPLSSGHSPPAQVDWRSSASLSADSPAPMSGDSPSPPSPQSTIDGMDIDVNGVSHDVRRQMPPPPMPAALDPTTISSVAFASTSPSATFSKLSLLSPVLPDMRSGSPSLFGMPVPNSARRPVLSSPPPYKSFNTYPPDSDSSSAQVVVYPPPSPNPSAHGCSPPHRVRFASPEVLQGQPSLKASILAPIKSARESTPTTPTVSGDDGPMSPMPSFAVDAVSPPTRCAVPDEQPDRTSLQVSPGPGDAPFAQTSTPPAPSDPTLHRSSMSETTASPTPSREPTRELSLPPVPKVKMSLKDFALRKKKQREEMAKERERECESPVVPGSWLPEESGDEGMHVDDDGQHSAADEGGVERKGNDCEGTDQGCDVSAKDVATTDVREVQDVVMDDEVRPTVKAEPFDSSAQQNVVGCMPEDPPADSRRRYESEQRYTPSLPPRSPVASMRSVNGMDKAPPNGQLADSTSLKAKIEVLEASIPIALVGADDRTSPSAPDPPPPPLHKADRKASPPRTYMSPLPPSAPASHGLSSRPSQEDGEITTSSPPKSSHFFPRSYTPPTQPRSFQTSHPSPPNFTHASSSSSASWRAPPTLPPTRPLSSTSTSASTPPSNGSSRPLPSGPRALRISSRPAHPPSYSSSNRAYSSPQYIPRGPSADRDRHDRDRLDWERERGWGPAPPRSRGRAGSGGWGR